MLHEHEDLVGILLEIRCQVVLGNLDDTDIAYSDDSCISGICFDDGHLAEILACLKKSNTERLLIFLVPVCVNTGFSLDEAEEAVADVTLFDNNFTLIERLLNYTHNATPSSDLWIRFKL